MFEFYLNYSHVFSENSSQAISRAVHVLQLISTADHGTEKLCLSAIALWLAVKK